MKKFLSAMLLLFVFTLVGCSSDKNTIQFWTPLTGEDGAYMDELVDKYKMELLNNEQLMDQFEERFEERLAAKSKEIEKE